MQILGGILKWSNYLKTKDIYFKIFNILKYYELLQRTLRSPS